MQPKLIVSFGRQTDADFLSKLDLILSSLKGNTHFPEPWPSPVPSLAQVQSDRDSYHAATIAAQSGDRFKITERNHARETIEDRLKHLAAYFEAIAHSDVDALTSTGFDLRQDIVRNIHSGPPPAPKALTAQHGAQSGTILLNAESVPGAKSYEIATTQADPTVEANWHHQQISASSHRIQIPNLTPGQIYWFRIRAIGKEAGIWGEGVKIMVV